MNDMEKSIFVILSLNINPALWGMTEKHSSEHDMGYNFVNKAMVNIILIWNAH